MVRKHKRELTNYNQGDLVFVKVKGYSNWPAKVDEIFETTSVKRYKVLFYGTHQTFEAKADAMAPFNEETKEKYGAKCKSKAFAKAMWEIENDPELKLVQEEHEEDDEEDNDAEEAEQEEEEANEEENEDSELVASSSSSKKSKKSKKKRDASVDESRRSSEKRSKKKKKKEKSKPSKKQTSENKTEKQDEDENTEDEKEEEEELEKENEKVVETKKEKSKASSLKSDEANEKTKAIRKVTTASHADNDDDERQDEKSSKRKKRKHSHGEEKSASTSKMPKKSKHSNSSPSSSSNTLKRKKDESEKSETVKRKRVIVNQSDDDDEKKEKLPKTNVKEDHVQNSSLESASKSRKKAATVQKDEPVPLHKKSNILVTNMSKINMPTNREELREMKKQILSTMSAQEKREEAESLKEYKMNQKKLEVIRNVRVQMTLLHMDMEIKNSLRLDNTADVDKCCKIMEDLLRMPLTRDNFIQVPYIVDTMRKCRKFKDSERVSKLATECLVKISELINVPAGESFTNVFERLVEQYETQNSEKIKRDRHLIKKLIKEINVMQHKASKQQHTTRNLVTPTSSFFANKASNKDENKASAVNKSEEPMETCDADEKKSIFTDSTVNADQKLLDGKQEVEISRLDSSAQSNALVMDIDTTNISATADDSLIHNDKLAITSPLVIREKIIDATPPSAIKDKEIEATPPSAIKDKEIEDTPPSVINDKVIEATPPSSATDDKLAETISSPVIDEVNIQIGVETIKGLLNEGQDSQ